MSTVNVRPSTNAAGAVGYILYGRDPEVRRELLRVGSTRAAAYAMSMVDGGSTPAEFIACAEAHAAAHGRTNQLQSYVLAFHPDEFDVTSQADLERIRDVAVELAERMHSADYMVAVHSDSAGGHGHAHILVINHDNLTGKSLQRYTSWKHGLRQLNDELMADEGLRVLPDPAEPKPDWELRREDFAPGGFEQVLGDKVYEAMTDQRSVNRGAFEQVLSEHGVTLAVTNRDGWSYKMRRSDNGKLGRKKASGLTPEFTAEGLQEIFDYHAQKGQVHGSTGQDQADRRAAEDYGDAGDLDLAARRRQSAAREADEDRRGPDWVREGDGRGADEEDGSAVDLAAARAALDAAARRRDEEEAERDREDARKRRAAAEQQRGREAVRRVLDHQGGPGRIHDDTEDQRGAEDDDFSLG